MEVLLIVSKLKTTTLSVVCTAETESYISKLKLKFKCNLKLFFCTKAPGCVCIHTPIARYQYLVPILVNCTIKVQDHVDVLALRVNYHLHMYRRVPVKGTDIVALCSDKVRSNCVPVKVNSVIRITSDNPLDLRQSIRNKCKPTQIKSEIIPLSANRNEINLVKMKSGK